MVFRFITLTRMTKSGRTTPQRVMLAHIVTWFKPMNGDKGTIVVTVEPSEDGWHFAETPEQIDEMIRSAAS